MAKLVYNNITFQESYLKTHTVDMSPVWSEDGVEYICTHFVISIQGIINTALAPANAGETTPVQVMRRIRSCLMQPRKTLTFSVAGETLIQAPVQGSTVDARNGPKPIRCNITAINGTMTFVVDYAVECWLNECCSTTNGTLGAPNQNAFVSHRWEEDLDLDDKFYTIRKVRGRIEVRTDGPLTPDQLIADAVDTTVGRGIPNGFERRNAHYTVTEDNTALSYSWEDHEVYKVAPAPAVRWEAIHTTNMPDMSKFHDEIVVRMWGDRFSAKIDMMEAAVKIAMGRLFPGQAIGDRNVLIPSVRDRFIVSGHLRENLHENMIELRFVVWATNIDQTLFGMIPAKFIGSDDFDLVKGLDRAPIASNYRPVAPGDQTGSKSLLLPAIGFLSKVISDPCLSAPEEIFPHGPPEDEGDDSSDLITGKPRVDVVRVLPTRKNLFDQTELNGGVYINYDIFTDYSQQHHVIQLPLAQSTGASTSIVQLAQPTLMKYVMFRATRIGSDPIIPTADSLDSNNVLVYTQISPAVAQPTPDGMSSARMIQGVYVYAVREVSEAKYVAGVLPFYDDPSIERSISDIIVEDGLLDDLGGSIFTEG